jgi:hypothetical protein
LRGEVGWKDAAHFGQEFGDQPPRERLRAVHSEKLFPLNADIVGHESAHGYREVLAVRLRQRGSSLLAIDDESPRRVAVLRDPDFKDAGRRVRIGLAGPSHSPKAGVGRQGQD